MWVNRFYKFFPVIALFFAVRLNKAKLPDWVDWILTAYVVFHVLTHLILTVRIYYLPNPRAPNSRNLKRSEEKSRENPIGQFINAKA